MTVKAVKTSLQWGGFSCLKIWIYWVFWLRVCCNIPLFDFLFKQDKVIFIVSIILCNIVVGIVTGQTSSIEQEQNGVNERWQEGSVFANKESILYCNSAGRIVFTKHCSYNCQSFIKIVFLYLGEFEVMTVLWFCPVITDQLSSIKTFWHSYTALPNIFANSGLISCDQYRVSPLL